MKKIYLVIGITTLLCIATLAQSGGIYIPKNIEDAIESKTRTLSGAPGESYWQNYSDYSIEAEINPETKLLSGKEKITYYNQSPDTLTNIVIRLYHDFYKKGGKRDWQISPNAVNDGVEISLLSVNSNVIEEGKIRRSGTNLFLGLPENLAPNCSVEISVEWNFTIPDESKLRMGVYDSTSFYVAYWYPQIAVYDDIDGWDRFDYSGTSEFYNDFNNYDVTIKMPKNYLVWATGVLQNPEEVLSERIAKKYKKAYSSKDVVNIVNEEDYSSGAITKNNNALNWRFLAKNVPDFMFGTSDHYLWDGVSAVADESKGKKVFTAAAYKKESKDFYEVADIARKSIEYFSTRLPGVAFPYPELTVFNGSGGMEAPMMVNDGTASTRAGMVGVTSHEIAHTYFPFYMGTNERKYSWMDEGWAVMLPFNFQAETDTGSNQRAQNGSGYSWMAGSEMDIPPMIPTIFLQSNSYRTASYSRPGLAYEFLYDMLGEARFKKALHHYMNQWNGKHPIPYDFFFSFNEALDEDLSWYWKPWFFESGSPDLGIEKVEETENKRLVTIEKIGNVPVPISVTVYNGEEEIASAYKAADVWKDNNRTYIIELEKMEYTRIELGGITIPDSRANNNTYFK